MSLKSVNDIHRGDGLSLGVLAVGNCITDHVLQEDLEDSPGLFVDQTADPLNTTSSCKSSDGGLGDTLDVITQDLSVALGTSLSQTFSSFTASRHVLLLRVYEVRTYQRKMTELMLDAERALIYTD